MNRSALMAILGAALVGLGASSRQGSLGIKRNRSLEKFDRFIADLKKEMKKIYEDEAEFDEQWNEETGEYEDLECPDADGGGNLLGMREIPIFLAIFILTGESRTALGIPKEMYFDLFGETVGGAGAVRKARSINFEERIAFLAQGQDVPISLEILREIAKERSADGVDWNLLHELNKRETEEFTPYHRDMSRGGRDRNASFQKKFLHDKTHRLKYWEKMSTMFLLYVRYTVSVMYDKDLAARIISIMKREDEAGGFIKEFAAIRILESRLPWGHPRHERDNLKFFGDGFENAPLLPQPTLQTGFFSDLFKAYGHNMTKRAVDRGFIRYRVEDEERTRGDRHWFKDRSQHMWTHFVKNLDRVTSEENFDGQRSHFLTQITGEKVKALAMSIWGDMIALFCNDEAVGNMGGAMDTVDAWWITLDDEGREEFSHDYHPTEIEKMISELLASGQMDPGEDCAEDDIRSWTTYLKWLLAMQPEIRELDADELRCPIESSIDRWAGERLAALEMTGADGFISDGTYTPDRIEAPLGISLTRDGEEYPLYLVEEKKPKTLERISEIGGNICVGTTHTYKQALKAGRQRHYSITAKDVNGDHHFMWHFDLRKSGEKILMPEMKSKNNRAPLEGTSTEGDTMFDQPFPEFDIAVMDALRGYIAAKLPLYLKAFDQSPDLGRYRAAKKEGEE